MKPIGIICAMESEMEILLENLSEKAAKHIGGIDVYTGTLRGAPVALCTCGMGKASAAAATQLLITGFGAGAIINSGIAGNMTGLLSIGDMAISTTTLYHDGEPKMINQSYPYLYEFTADEALVGAAAKTCRELGVKCATGRIATGDQFIGEAAVKKRIADAYAPLCVEMEGAAIGHIAAKNDVPFVVLRSMSDDADESGYDKLVVKQFDVQEYCRTVSAITMGTIEKYISE
ncbi:5'-methylthioadenosine/adenosylhomocysteine nucleosidase [Ruminococcaceae bacterium OttesenSCG-928-N02]|nr:5'-methylthioadenosine/adenosylhomocysteine nucleosidase [Ruminococcaceae bacterium OttesenSCG-928-N02]